MGEKERAPFVKLSEEDKVRFDREMKQFETLGYFVDKDGVKSSELRIQKPKFKSNVVQPKKAKTAYTFYVKELFAKNYKKSESGAKEDFQSVTKKLNEAWNNMSEAQKKPFFTAAENDRKRHYEELQSLLTKGFFINEKGQKSSELKPKLIRNKSGTPSKTVELPKKRLANDDGQPATKKLKQ